MIEFAIAAPVLATLLLGTFEVSKYIQTNTQVVRTVAMLGQMASQLPHAATTADVQRIWSAAPLIAPESLRVAREIGRRDWSDALAVTLTSVVFEKRDPACQSGCEIEARVGWSVGHHPYPCGVLPKGSGSAGAVPEELYAAGSALWIEASLPYRPYLLGSEGRFAGIGAALTSTMSESSWFMPRATSRIVLSAGGRPSPASTLCPESER